MAASDDEAVPRSVAIPLALALAVAAVEAALLLRPHRSTLRQPNVVSELWSVPASGGSPRLLLRVRRQLAEPAFAPDGSLLLLRTGEDVAAPARLVRWQPGAPPRQVGTRAWGLTSPGIAWSPRRDRVVLATDRGIELVDPNRGARRLLAPGLFDAPAWSADGRTIAFTARRKRADGAYVGKVWTIRPDGSGRRLVVSVLAPISGPALSPDGRLLALSLRGKAELLDLRTRRLRALPIRTPSYSGFAWSADGRLLLHQGDHGLRVLRLGDGRDRLLAPLGFDGVFSPDGLSVVFLRVHVGLISRPSTPLPMQRSCGACDLCSSRRRRSARSSCSRSRSPPPAAPGPAPSTGLRTGSSTRRASSPSAARPSSRRFTTPSTGARCRSS
jgi:hypothetical protein